MKTYRGYTGTVEFSEEDMVFHGKLVGIDGLVTYEATTAEGLVKAFHESVDDYLELCERTGRKAQKPFSGKLALRMTPDLHGRLSAAAARNAKSLNQWIVDALETKVSESGSKTYVLRED